MAIRAKFYKKMQVNMDNDTFEEVKRLSDEQGVSYAEIIRQALEAGLPNVRGQKSTDASIL